MPRVLGRSSILIRGSGSHGEIADLSTDERTRTGELDMSWPLPRIPASLPLSSCFLSPSRHKCHVMGQGDG